MKNANVEQGITIYGVIAKHPDKNSPVTLGVPLRNFWQVDFQNLYHAVLVKKPHPSLKRIQESPNQIHRIPESTPAHSRDEQSITYFSRFCYIAVLKPQFMVIHSSFSDFILFLYVHLSHADNSYDPTELAAIKDKMKIIFPSTTDFERKLYQAIREYNSFDKSRFDELLKATAIHFKHEKANKQVLDSFHDIVNADGKIGQEEAKALETLKQIIG